MVCCKEQKDGLMRRRKRGRKEMGKTRRQERERGIKR
jgi:hypothetical protein